MGKERMQFQPLKEAPQETYVEIKVPASSYHLFNAVMEHPVDGPTEEYVRHIEKSVSINNEMYVMPEIYEDGGAPKGKIHAGKLEDSKFYPGIGHEYWVYVPAQYDPQTPVNLVVFYDGGFIMKDAETGAQREDVPTVTMLDNMIAQGKLPVTIALFAASCIYLNILDADTISLQSTSPAIILYSPLHFMNNLSVVVWIN